MVLLDVEMPELDGYETCKRMRTDSSLSEIPVIFLTAYSENINILSGFEAGAQDYISKPFNQKELLARIQTHILLKQKKDEIKKLNHQLTQKNKDITDSILYAKKIQSAILPSENILFDNNPDSFILHKPKDIVSGDFYWFKNNKNTLYLAAADCTGHGVPGALMSMLGITHLNEITNGSDTIKPSELLNKLRTRLVIALNQNNNHHETRDGMDISICSINSNDHTLHYAGANSVVYIVRPSAKQSGAHEEISKKNQTPDCFQQSQNSNLLQDKNKTLIIELKPDRMPVGVHPNYKNSFTDHEIKTQSGDSIYLFSDGYLSQFGGEKNKKLNYRKFKKILCEIQNLPMKRQQQKLEEKFETWKGVNEQVDDVLVIGYKIP
ncbi:MAG: response regulator [Bacteroidia bacterium]|nr:response regulator [Bacteroidia bacterium]